MPATNRIFAIILKNVYILRHNLDRKTELLYWPTIDLILWGVTSLYFRELAPENTQIVVNIVSGLLLWYVLWQGQNEVNLSILSELWYKNLVNLFVSPLRFFEYIGAFMLSGIVKTIFMFAVSSGVAMLLYQVNVLKVGLWLLPLSFILIMMGWAYSFLTAGLNLRYGTRMQSITWTMVFMLSPFSAVYYPVSILPDWGQYIAALLPSSYVFEAMRSLVNGGSVDIFQILFAFCLMAVYLLLAAVWLRFSFEKALDQGLVKLK